ncbi:MAG: hypothetical protein JWO31_1073, partial [Phycisphaerales bacterium]|nr:hypothetical protein [Phycisphaerales bacterium]
TQSTPAERFLRDVRADAAGSLAGYIRNYETTRAKVLGLPMYGQDQTGQFAEVPRGPGELTLQQRLDAIGAGLVPLLTDNAAPKAMIETLARAKAGQLGGLDAVDPQGEWAFLLAYRRRDPLSGALVRGEDGEPVWELPGLPFVVQRPSKVPGKQAAVYSVNIAVGPDGRGTAAFTLLNPDVAGVVAGGGDPL